MKSEYFGTVLITGTCLEIGVQIFKKSVSLIHVTRINPSQTTQIFFDLHMDLNKILNAEPPISKYELLSKGICPICKKQLADKSSCQRHIKLVHSPPLPCLFCKRKIKFKGRIDLLRQHLVRCDEFISHCKQLSSVGEGELEEIVNKSCYKIYEDSKEVFENLTSNPGSPESPSY